MVFYIDPGTGSMLFSLFIGLITTGVFGLRALIIKIHSVVGRGKKEEQDCRRGSNAGGHGSSGGSLFLSVNSTVSSWQSKSVMR